MLASLVGLGYDDTPQTVSEAVPLYPYTYPESMNPASAQFIGPVQAPAEIVELEPEAPAQTSFATCGLPGLPMCGSRSSSSSPISTGGLMLPNARNPQKAFAGSCSTCGAVGSPSCFTCGVPVAPDSTTCATCDTPGSPSCLSCGAPVGSGGSGKSGAGFFDTLKNIFVGVAAGAPSAAAAYAAVNPAKPLRVPKPAPVIQRKPSNTGKYLAIGGGVIAVAVIGIIVLGKKK